MYGLDLEDYARVIIKSLILTFICAMFLFGAYYLIRLNINVAYYISDITGIPRDLELTVMSAGFANNIIILLTTFEFGIIIYLVNKITNTKIYNNVAEFVINL